jgi:thiopeptide-type bacteriocin biosynthesis protein
VIAVAPQRGELEPSGFFVLRTPLLPVEELQTWWEAADPSAALHALAARPDVRDALFLASPSLLDALGDPDRAAKAEPALAAYLTRASTRCTPFGLFAGCATGVIGPRTALTLGPSAEHRRHTRLDNDHLFALVSALEHDPAIRRDLTWRPNTSLYRAGGRLRYAEARLAGTLRSHHLVAVDETEDVRATLARAAEGATLDELAAALVDDDVALDQAEAFVEAVIDSQLLVSDLEVQVTGDEPTRALADRLAGLPQAAGVADALAEVTTKLATIDAGGVGADLDDYRAVAARLEPLPAPVEPARLLQVDLVTSAPGVTLGRGVVEEVARAVEVLGRLALPRPDDPLTRFRDEFVERFESREVPVADALDEEIGIAFAGDPLGEGAPLVDDLDLRPPAPATTTWAARDAALFRRLARALQDGHQQLELDDGDLAALEVPDRPPLPDALEVMATIAAASAEAVDEGAFRLLVRGIDGGSGVRLLGRFCHSDAELHQQVSAHLRREEAQRPDAVFAEVVHLPDGRLGNILCRPVLRSHEIEYLGRSGAPPERLIPLSDLVVAVRGGRVVLRSRRLDREVLPRLTTAHDYATRSLAIYRFLCAVQSQGAAAGLAWQWGALAGAPFLPRVTSGRLVLARARWTLRGKELRSLPLARLPRHVALVEGDRELVTDLDAPASRDALVHRLRGRTEATLNELFPTVDELCVTGPEGRHLHEILVPFVRTPPPAPAARRATPPITVRRSFAPGSAWTYAKLYTGTATADRVLAQVVRPLVDEALTAGVADSWFLIRYADPHWHLRVRLRGDAGRVITLLHDAAAPLLADGSIWRVQLDTYERELERYGGDAGMALSEALFHHDSEAVLAIVETLRGDEGLDARWRLAVVGIDRLLDDLGLDLAAKAGWAKERRDAFAREFGVDGRVAGQIGRRHRLERDALERLLAVDDPGDHPLAPGLLALRARSERLAPVAAELRRRAVDVAGLAASYAHMHANRLLRSAHRRQELVLSDLLLRLYTTRQHRGGTP